MSVVVAYVVHTFDIGGIERCVARLANGLDPARFRPLVVCLSKQGAASKWIERGDVPVIALNKPARNSRRTVRRLAELLREHQVDVVHSHNWGTLVETVLARRSAHTPVHIHTEHGQGLHEGLRGPRRWVRRLARRWAFERVDQLLVCAESVRPLIHTQCGFPEERMQFLPNGVDEPCIASNGDTPPALRRRLGIGPDAFVVGSVGRLAAVKSFGTAIRATAILRERGVDVHLVLVGDGPEEESLRRMAGEAGLGKFVHLVGRHEDVSPWLDLLDVYVNCSRSEAMSLGILEAMAARRPMVVSDVGDNRRLAGGDDGCGVVVPPERPDELAGALQVLRADPGRRERLSHNAGERFEREYSTRRMLADHSALYLHCLHGRIAEQSDPRARRATAGRVPCRQ
jgi:glycosyltransferase involved in cell wall biosynthesis